MQLHSSPKIPKQVKEQRPGIRWLNRPEQHGLLRRIERYGDLRDLGAIKVLLNTGLRVSELANLLWSDVEISDRKGSLIVRSGKGTKRRTIPLNKEKIKEDGIDLQKIYQLEIQASNVAFLKDYESQLSRLRTLELQYFGSDPQNLFNKFDCL
jgi:integrase